MQVGNLNAANVARTYTTQVGSGGAGTGRSAAAAYGAQAKPRTDSVAVSSTRMEVMRARRGGGAAGCACGQSGRAEAANLKRHVSGRYASAGGEDAQPLALAHEAR